MAAPCVSLLDPQLASNDSERLQTTKLANFSKVRRPSRRLISDVNVYTHFSSIKATSKRPFSRLTSSFALKFNIRQKLHI